MNPSPAVTLFGHWICPFSVRVEWALAQRGISYDVTEVPPSAVRPRDFVVPDEFVQHSPKLEVPMVRIGERYLADSIPILEWLEEELTDRPLLPTHDAELVRKRVAWIDRHVYRPMIGVYYGVDQGRITAASDQLGAGLEQVGEWVIDGWCAGAGPSLCEALLVPLYVRLDGLRRLGFTAPVPPAVTDHLERCRATEGWATVEWSADQIDEFVGRFEKYRAINRA